MWSVEFLAAGEYNENYVVHTESGSYVFRVNHGTQLGLANQIGYEFDVLTAVSTSGHTPLPLAWCRTHRDFPNGALLMSYLDGGRFEYQRDMTEAARVFAKIHQLPLSSRLIVQANPILDIVAECRRLISRYDPHPLPAAGAKISEYLDQVQRLGRESAREFVAEPLCIVNTEVNSGNFIVAASRDVYLVDWEKAVVSARYQDLGHFLVPTTTLWKSNYRFDRTDRHAFLTAYHEALDDPPEFERLDRLTDLLERTILLRAYSWCFMAYVEYTDHARALRDEHTFGRITYYLEHIDEFLAIE